MIDDVDSEPPVSDLPNPARVYRDYLLTCRRMGVTPTSPDRAKVLLKEWPTRSPLPRRGRLRSRIASSVPKAATSKAFAVAAALTYRTDLSDSNPSAARRSHVARWLQSVSGPPFARRPPLHSTIRFRDLWALRRSTGRRATVWRCGRQRWRRAMAL